MLPAPRQFKDRLLRCLAAGYVAGPHLADALRICRLAAARGWAASMGPWDGPGDMHASIMTRYLAAVEAIGESGLDCSLSIKAPALKYDFGVLHELLAAGRARGVRLHFDSLGPDSAAPTFRLMERLLALGGVAGCTLPARWSRSMSDAERALEWGIPVRLVKGQWAGSNGAAVDPSAGFRRLARFLAGRAPQVGVATHDARLASECLALLAQAGTPCELEQLYGLPVRLAVARTLGVNLRMYIPYGHAWLPYCLSHVRRRPVVLAWILRDLLRGTRPKAKFQVSGFKFQVPGW